uniref:LIM zinc-binding domain-containing protein n=1 Tax=Wuchereria bancrofti TaxID=6293 RepID=A0A1I8EJ14_WUCBA
MEIHHRLYEKSINYNTATIAAAAAAANNLVPILCDTNDASGISENSHFCASISSLINNTDAFVSLNRTTLNINEFPGYSNSSTGLLNHSIKSDLSLDLSTTIATQTVALTTETSSEIKNDLIANNHHHCQQQQQQHQQQQQRQKSEQTLTLQNAENNICAIVGTIALQTEKSNTTMIITTNRSRNSSSGNDGANVSSNNNNCNCAITTANEPNFSHRISKFEVEICSSCSEFILDRTLLTVNSRFWHINCLKCSQCSILLEQYSSCFVKDNNFFCIQCYN